MTRQEDPRQLSQDDYLKMVQGFKTYQGMERDSDRRFLKVLLKGKNPNRPNTIETFFDDNGSQTAQKTIDWESTQDASVQVVGTEGDYSFLINKGRSVSGEPYNISCMLSFRDQNGEVQGGARYDEEGRIKKLSVVVKNVQEDSATVNVFSFSPDGKGAIVNNVVVDDVDLFAEELVHLESGIKIKMVNELGQENVSVRRENSDLSIVFGLHPLFDFKPLDVRLVKEGRDWKNVYNDIPIAVYVITKK